MGRRSLITGKQLEVLRWVADGCPDGVFEGNGHKTTAGGLQNRRLITVSRSGGVWSAQLTPVGQHYLDHKEFPAGDIALHPVRRHPARPPKPRTTTEERKPSAAKPPTVAQQLVLDVIAAGGRLRPPNGSHSYEWYELVRNANRTSALPADYWLDTQGRSEGKFEVVLVETPGTRIPLCPVPLPAKVAQFHPVVAKYRNSPDFQEVYPDHLARAALLLQALAVECDRRGHRIKWAKGDRFQHSTRTHGQFQVTVDGRTRTIRINEKRGPKGERLNWQLASTRKLPLWQKSAHYVYESTGILRLTVDDGISHRGRTAVFIDGKTSLIEDKLPHLLRELEIRAAEDVEREKHTAEEAVRQRTRWEVALRQAELDYVEAKREEFLERQVDSWHRANEFRAYLEAMRVKVNQINDPVNRAAAEEWLRWAEEHVELTDPLDQPLGMPVVPKPTRHDLVPFMPCMSPFQPPTSRYVQ